MSGSDPSVRQRGRTGDGDGGGAGPDECPGNPFETVLASPDPTVVDDLNIGEVLDVEAVDTPIRGVLASRVSGEYVGAVTREILRLRRCISGGVSYEAEVIRLAGGSVTVRIQER